MKLKLLLISLVLSAATNVIIAKEKELPVNAEQVRDMQSIIEEITKGNESGEGGVNSPEELFKIINGGIQTTDRELPVPAAITKANSKNLRLVCYQEGDEKVVASNDPTLLGKSNSDFKTADGTVVQELAIKKIRESKKASGKEVATFTYAVQPDKDAPMVNGKPVTEGRVVVAAGRKAFPFQSEKKFLCTVGAKIAAAQ